MSHGINVPRNMSKPYETFRFGYWKVRLFPTICGGLMIDCKLLMTTSLDCWDDKSCLKEM